MKIRCKTTQLWCDYFRSPFSKTGRFGYIVRDYGNHYWVIWDGTKTKLKMSKRFVEETSFDDNAPLVKELKASEIF